MPEARTVALLKVDVEGYERFVFSGASAVLARARAVYFEVWEHHFGPRGYSTTDVVALLADHGFVTCRFGPAGVERVDASYQAISCVNLVAVRPEEAARLPSACGFA